MKQIGINREILSAIKRLDAVKNSTLKAIIKEIDRIREQIILAIAQEEEINPRNAGLLKDKIRQIIDEHKSTMELELSDNARRVFVKGIQVIDKAIESYNLRVALPYLSETKLKVLQRYHAELITNIADDLKHRIDNELVLAQLGQKPVNQVIKDIGRTLPSKGIFKTVAKRALTIFRTEVNRIGNIASQSRIEQFAGTYKNMGKQWIHSHIGIPRAGHLMLDRVIVGWDEPFELQGQDGKTYYPMMPHDPILPAGEVVNCKCMVIPVLI